MIKNLFIMLLFLIFCHGHGSAEAGQEIVVVQSLRIKPYEKAIEGFRSVCNSKIKRLFVSEWEGANVVEKINKIGPDIVLAVGTSALLKIKKIKDIPVIYLMVLNHPHTSSGKKNITGISMKTSQEQQLITLLKAVPDTKNIGLLYDPDRTGHFVKKAHAAAKKIGIKLIAKEIHSARDAPSAIMNMRGKIDIFWMLPDLTVITPETVEFLLLFSLENKIPILTFSEKYVEMGALMSIGIDAFDIGIQAGEMAKKIFLGRDIKSIKRVDARKAVVSINLIVAKKLNITIDKKIINNAMIIE